MKPDTCVLGFNSIRFDDEMTRYLFYRNFFDPYAYAWRNGNSRWDVLDLIRGIYALRPQGINWPVIDGKVSLKLEEIAKANHLEHESAHDALSDVYATLAVLKLIKTKQPRFFEYFYQNRRAKNVQMIVEKHMCKPLVHVSGMFGEVNGYLSLVMPIAMHPWNKNAVIVVDLRGEMNELIDYSADEIKSALYTATADLQEGRSRVPLKLVHLNKCPIVAPLNVLRDVDNLHGLDIQSALDKASLINANFSSIEKKLLEVFKPTTAPSYGDQAILYRVESMLYDGFFSPEDKKIMEHIPSLSGEDLALAGYQFKDARIAPLLFLYRAKNYPQTLTEDERKQWVDYCETKRDAKQESLKMAYEQCIQNYPDNDPVRRLLDECYAMYFE